MFVIIEHNEHAFSSPSDERVIGPFEDAKAGVAYLEKLLTTWNEGRVREEDGLHKLYAEPNPLEGYVAFLGGDEANPEDVQDSDIWGEVWAELIEVTPPGWNKAHPDGS